MYKISFFSLLLIFSLHFSQGGSVGINTKKPTNTLHIKGDGVRDPLRIENLLTDKNTKNIQGILVTDPDGKVKMQDLNTVSAFRGVGSVTLMNDSIEYPINVTQSVAEEYDNLDEFSADTFTPVRSGLYLIIFNVNYLQELTGDGYLGYAVISKNGTLVEQSSSKISLSETSKEPDYIQSQATALLKLDSKDQIKFLVKSYGAIHPRIAQYVLSILRLN